MIDTRNKLLDPTLKFEKKSDCEVKMIKRQQRKNAKWLQVKSQV